MAYTLGVAAFVGRRATGLSIVDRLRLMPVVSTIPALFIAPDVGSPFWWIVLALAAHCVVFISAGRFATRAPDTYLQHEFQDADPR